MTLIEYTECISYPAETIGETGRSLKALTVSRDSA